MERLYIVQGERGLFKAGRTRRLAIRLRAMEQEFARDGDRVARHQSFGEIPNAQEAERLLLWRLTDAGYPFARSNSREWFQGVDFAFAARAAEECTRLGAPYTRLDTGSDEYIAKKRAEMAEAVARGVNPNCTKFRIVRQTLINKLVAAHGRRSFDALVQVLSDRDARSARRCVDHHPV